MRSAAYHRVFARWLRRGCATFHRTYVEIDKSTVRGFLIDEWLPAVRPTVRPSTHKLYETLATAYVVPRIGAVMVQKLSPGQLNRLYAEPLETGARGGKPLGAETTRKVHRLMHRALRDAVRRRLAFHHVVERREPMCCNVSEGGLEPPRPCGH